MEVMNLATCDTVALPRFESLPPEVRNMIYIYLLNPTGRCLHINHFSLRYRCTPAGQKTDIDILRTNHNINREALAILYRDVTLVSIEWNQSERSYLDLFRMPQEKSFYFVLPGAAPPPCAVRVEQRYDNEDSRAVRNSTIVAAADFAAMCESLLKSYLIPRYDKYEEKTSYSVISLPTVGYNVERLRELIWNPLLALRKGHSRDLGDRIHRNIRAIDCTGVFEQTPAVSDWNSRFYDEAESDPGNEYYEGKSDDRGSEMDISGEEDGDAGDGDEGDGGEDESSKGEDWNEEDSDEGEDGDDESVEVEEWDEEEDDEGR